MTSTPIFRPNGWTDHRAAAAALQEQPGVWLLVSLKRARYSAESVALSIRYGRKAYAPAGAYEARVEPVGDETGVYARYICTPLWGEGQ